MDRLEEPGAVGCATPLRRAEKVHSVLCRGDALAVVLAVVLIATCLTCSNTTLHGDYKRTDAVLLLVARNLTASIAIID